MNLPTDGAVRLPFIGADSSARPSNEVTQSRPSSTAQPPGER